MICKIVNATFNFFCLTYKTGENIPIGLNIQDTQECPGQDRQQYK